ncbi:FAD-dependent oxidoreductase [Nocardioides sp. KR10-350]|uniref:GcvT family protein n=1 Tax=Nocardioides cheoyonin TaxID=3156615 RepID=UPI0032B53117
MVGRRTVIIGAGVVGAALADELSERGWDDVVVVDQGDIPVTGGSSSHAPGLVFQTNSSKTMTQMARYTVEKLMGLSYDGEPCFLQVGGLEIATTPERLAELHRRHGWVTAWGIEAEIVDPEQCAKLFPLLDPATVFGGLYVPTDGIAKAIRGVAAQLERAQDRGVELRPRTEVLEILVEDGSAVGVRTTDGDIPADVVVCCAGIWGPKVAGLVGLRLPQTPMAHQLAWTGTVPGLEGRAEEAVSPLLRHQDADLYYRERYDGLGVGTYRHRAMPIDAHDLLPVDEAAKTKGGMPSVLEFTPEDFAPSWEETHRVLPATEDVELTDAINGVFSFTPDGMPLIGESPDVAGFWVAEAVWVTHSAGVGRAVAELLVDGASSYDLSGCELDRFEEYQLDPAYVVERNCTSFDEVYDIIHPLQPMEHPRPLRTSPFYVRERELGGVFLEASGWERPQWYAANDPRTDVSTGSRSGTVFTPDPWAARYWSPTVAAEARATREAVAVYDMTALKRLEVTGPGAAAFLQRMVTGNVDKSVGSVTYCLLLNPDGGIRSDVTVARLAEDRFQVGANGNADLAWLRRHLPADGTVQVRDITGGTCCLGLWGPQARDVLQPLADIDLSNDGLRYFRAAGLHVGNVPVTALRLSYVGELGWELYTSAEFGLRLWDTIWAAGQDHGLVAAGRGAFNSLRLEKGYRSFGADMTFEHDPWEAGLGFAVKLDSGDFIGRDAVVRRQEQVTRRLVTLTLDDPAKVVMGKEPVLAGGTTVGYVTSAAYGYTVGRGVAYAWLPAELAAAGTPVEITYFDTRVAATVADDVLVDPSMSKLRS